MDRGYSRKRSNSPSSRRGRQYRGYDDRKDGRVEENYRDTEKRRYQEKSYPERRGVKPVPEMRIPTGFPEGYSWNKGDWLCPSRGCEGFVTAARFRNCIHCGRAQPHFTVLMELAKGEAYRGEICSIANCRGRDCIRAHFAGELRDLNASRVYQKSGESSPPMIPPSPSSSEISDFVARWRIREPGVSVLNRLPGPLGDLMLRSFMVGSDVRDEDLTNHLLKGLADIIRPKTTLVNTQTGFHDMLTTLLKVYSTPVGVACNESGQTAITLEKEVLLLRTRDYTNEDLGLLAFAISFSGLSLVHSLQDKINLAANFPKVYSDMFNRVRLVDHPSDIIYKATDPLEEVTDRATQAKIDAMNPAPLLPTPEPEPSSIHVN